MNLLGHVRIALEVSDDRADLAGAILPDLESLLGDVVGDGRSAPDLQRGIRLHHLTDAAFHGDPRFRDGSIALTRSLQAEGVGRGASRAIGHAGWELVLDGVLSAAPSVTTGFDRALADLRGRAVPDSRLPQLIAMHESTPFWQGYADPHTIVERLHRQLAHRPLLAIPTEHIPVAAAVLADTAPSIEAVAEALVADVATKVRKNVTTP